MDNIKTEVRTINELFSGAKTRFLVPDYQRPYAWTEEECGELWNDIKEFAINGFDADKSEYFLGAIVTYSNKNRQDEIIDGQQRLTSLLLLMRAYYAAFNGKNEPPIKNDLGKCIWFADERGVLDKTALKITSEVLQNSANEELATILLTGSVDKSMTGRYADNYGFFQQCIANLKEQEPTFFELLPARLLNNCYVIKIRPDSQQVALQMFNTLNAKGMPLSETDIFKAILYKDALAVGGNEEKNIFVERWHRLEKRCNEIFTKSKRSTPLAFAFLTYTYKNDELSFRRSIDKVYGANDFELLRKPETLREIEALVDFFQDLRELNQMRFDYDTLRKVHILLRPNSVEMLHALSGYFTHKCVDGYKLDDADFNSFLDRSIAFFLGKGASGIANSTGFGYKPILQLIKEPAKIIREQIFSKRVIESNLRNFKTLHGKIFAREIILNWWTFKNENQELLPLEQKFSIEHIFPRRRADFEPLNNPDNIELLGNMALLERNLNSQASDYRFADKSKFYLGAVDRRGQFKKGTCNRELQTLATTKTDFAESDIVERNEQMIAEILATLDERGFLQP